MTYVSHEQFYRTPRGGVISQVWLSEWGQNMSKFVTSVKNFLVSEDGPTAVEYAIMLALIVIVCIGSVQSIGTSANAKFGAANAALK